MYGWGAFETVFRHDICDSTDGDKHPTPYNDIQLGWSRLGDVGRDSYYFGFASLAQMRQWVYMPKWRRALADYGLVLRKYRVPAKYFRRSPFQAIFRRREATLIETRRPDYADRKVG